MNTDCVRTLVNRTKTLMDFKAIDWLSAGVTITVSDSYGNSATIDDIWHEESVDIEGDLTEIINARLCQSMVRVQSQLLDAREGTEAIAKLQDA